MNLNYTNVKYGEMLYCSRTTCTTSCSSSGGNYNNNDNNNNNNNYDNHNDKYKIQKRLGPELFFYKILKLSCYLQGISEVPDTCKRLIGTLDVRIMSQGTKKPTIRLV